jgi:hypothetical protein
MMAGHFISAPSTVKKLLKRDTTKFAGGTEYEIG